MSFVSSARRCDGVEIDGENDSDLLVLTTASYSPGCHAANDDGPDVTQPGRRDLKMGRCDLSLGYQRRLAKEKLMWLFVRITFAFVFSAHSLFCQKHSCLDFDQGWLATFPLQVTPGVKLNG